MEREKYEQELFGKILSSLKEQGFEKYVKSFIVTGSFGRDEPTYHMSNGELTLKSDVEMALVCTNKNNMKAATKITEKTCNDFSEDLNFMIMKSSRLIKGYNFNFSIKPPRYKTIFTYDLYNGSKTIWGQDFLTSYKPTLESVDPYEAKRIVANRLGEYLYNKKQNNADLDKIWLGKTIIAIGSAVLLLKGIYKTSYHEQKDLIETNKEQFEFLGKEFVDSYLTAFSYLREGSKEFLLCEEELCRYVNLVNEVFEKRNLHHPKINSFSRILKYYLKYFNKYKKIDFYIEDKTLSGLIKAFYIDKKSADTFAEIWHKVLY